MLCLHFHNHVSWCFALVKMAEGGRCSGSELSEVEIDQWTDEEEGQDDGLEPEEVEEDADVVHRARGLQGYMYEPEYTEEELQERAAAVEDVANQQDRMNNNDW